MKKFDIIIVGGGIVGSALALMLAQHTSFAIAIFEAEVSSPTFSPELYHHRVSAITLASQRIFERLNIWDAIVKRRVSPFTHIHVWDASSQGEIHFDCQEIAESLLGYIIENNVMQLAFVEKIKQSPLLHSFPGEKFTRCIEENEQITLITADETVYQANLVVGADGANSWLRESANIALQNVIDYEQKAIVATVQSERPHDRIARQVFLKTGPLAFLPLASTHTSSIVWSMPKMEADQLMEKELDAFKNELVRASSACLGSNFQIGERHAFPLRKQQAKNYVKNRLALIGDAAHTVHPLAGQGVNMGLLDAACLAEIIIDAVKRRRNYASLNTLRRYERWRKADNAAMMIGIDVLKNIFANNKKQAKSLRSIGLNCTNQFAPLKKMFARYAVGNRSDLPQFAQPNFHD